MWHYRVLLLSLDLMLCSPLANAENNPRPGSYFDQTGRQDILTGGVRMITVQTPDGPFRVWTKRVGNNPRTKVLLLHGGPGATHEYFEALDSYFPGAGIEYYYYDQLGSVYSDQPDLPELWALPRFVDRGWRPHW
jgi:proline iminopeptidase